MMLDEMRSGATMADVLRENVRVRPGAEALTDGARRLNWLQLQDAALAVCAQFATLGIGAGDRIAVALPNQSTAVLLYWACALSGVVYVGLNPRMHPSELELLISHSGARAAFFADGSLAERISSAQLPPLQEIVTVTEGDPVGFFSQPRAGGFQTTSRSRDDIFTICYTSTVGERPKGALLSHGNLVWNAGGVAEILRCSADDVFLLGVGLNRIFGISGLLTAALTGARSVLLQNYAAGDALDVCEWERVTVHPGTPNMFALELAAQRRAPRDLSSLRTGIVAAAPVQPELIDAIRSELHCNAEIGWGLTEASPAVTMTRPGDPHDARRSSVGRPLDGVELQVLDGEHQFGELLVRGPGVCSGYHNDPELTRRHCTDDGWLHSGDLGYIDDGGFVHLTGRTNEIIFRSGMHVFPGEIEAILMDFPWVENVAVIGIPDPILGERTCACIVVNQNTEPPADLLYEVRTAVASRLADYKVPDAVLRVAELPRGSGGKILKGLLREDAIARVGSD